MKKKLYKTVSILLSITFLMGSLTACGRSENNDHKIKLAVMRTGFTLPLYYAVQQGYFEEAGLEIDVQYFDNGPQINEAIAAGDVDVAGIGQMPSITGGIANNSKVVAWMGDDELSIQAYARNDSDIVKAGKGNLTDYPEIYGTADEWKGKSIICARGTSSHYGLLAVLAALGISESDITVIDMEGSKGAATFAAGEGDIFFGFDPQWSEFYSNSDKYTLVSSCKDAGNTLYCMLIASEAFCSNNPEELTRFIEVLLKAEEELRTDEDKYYEEMYQWQSFYGNGTEELAKYSASIKPIRTLEEQKRMFTETGDTSEVISSYERVIDFMVINHVITEADKTKFYDNHVLDAEYLLQAIENYQK